MTLSIRSDTNEKEAAHAMQSSTEVRLHAEDPWSWGLDLRDLQPSAGMRSQYCESVSPAGRTGLSSKSRRTRLNGSRVVAGGPVRASRRQRPIVIHQELRTERDIERVDAHRGTAQRVTVAPTAPCAAGGRVAAFRDAAGESVAGGFQVRSLGDGGWLAHDGAC